MEKLKWYMTIAFLTAAIAACSGGPDTSKCAIDLRRSNSGDSDLSLVCSADPSSSAAPSAALSSSVTK